MHDIFGHVLKVGDTVAFSPSKMDGLVVGEIVAFSRGQVRVGYTNGKGHSYREALVDSEHVVLKR